MAELAEAAGVSRATLYRAHPSKRALLEALRRGGVALEEPPEPEARALAAVERVLLEGGFAALTMERVAADAALSLRTVYRCFGDRAGLLRAFIRSRRWPPVPIRPARPIASAEDVERALVEHTRALLEALEEGKALLRLALAAPGETGEVLREVRAAERGSVATLAAFLEEQMEAGWLRRDDARTLAAAYGGQLLAAVLLLPEAGERLPDRDRLARTLARVFVHGVAWREAGRGRTRA